MSDEPENMEPLPDVEVQAPAKPQGAQVVLTGAAQAAARGELHGEMHMNVAARDAAMGAEPETLPEGMSGTHQDIETKHYSDGTSATGPGPLPDLSPAQQEAAELVPEPIPEPPAHDSPIVD